MRFTCELTCLQLHPQNSHSEVKETGRATLGKHQTHYFLGAYGLVWFGLVYFFCLAAVKPTQVQLRRHTRQFRENKDIMKGP